MILNQQPSQTESPAMLDSQTNPVISRQSLGPTWPTMDPFLFCAYHDDAYPAGNAEMGPDASLAGRNIGQDFSRKDGWSMYHGQKVAGFPPHPHRGFETVTLVRKGLIDHSDSLGAIARFGQGDVQWLTAGSGIVHAEMFPLLETTQPNPLELFQVWLNLPAKNKMAKPHFTMLWSQQIPRLIAKDAHGRVTEVVVVAGKLQVQGAPTAAEKSVHPLPPPPDSWAAELDSDLAIWTLKMAPGASWTLPAASAKDTVRNLYFFKGQSVSLNGQPEREHAALELQADQDVMLENTGSDEAEFLLLQGQPIAEPVVQHGPFVMNTQAEIVQTLSDYRRTQFGGWAFDPYAPVHGREATRFARHPDGREEKPSAQE